MKLLRKIVPCYLTEGHNQTNGAEDGKNDYFTHIV